MWSHTYLLASEQILKLALKGILSNVTESEIQSDLKSNPAEIWDFRSDIRSDNWIPTRIWYQEDIRSDIRMTSDF